MTPLALQIAPDCVDRVRVGWVLASPVSVVPADEGLTQEIDALAAELRARHEGSPPSEIPGLDQARRLYRSFGIDPTRTRPSSEALIRRAVRGKAMPRVSNAVDLCNLCSMAFPLPIGLFDAGCIRGPVVLRAGRAGESYPGIRKADVHLEGRPVLADAEGPFGNPTSDSLRTSVREETRALWMVIFAPADYPSGAMHRHLDFAAERLGRYLLVPGAEARIAKGSVPEEGDSEREVTAAPTPPGER